MAAGHLVSWKKSHEEGFNILLHANKEEKELPIRIDCLDDGQQEDSGEVYLLSTKVLSVVRLEQRQG